MQENYLAKWLNGELSGEELQKFEASEEYATYAKILKASEQLEAPNFDVENALHTFKNSQLKEEPKVMMLDPYKYFLRVAAVIAFLLVGSYFYLNSTSTNIGTELAEQTETLLPDQSKVILNADSKITYSAKKWKSNRNLTLKGEAFFKVAKGQKFTVHTDLGKVTVLGTEFNVESREGFFEVTCYEGLVSVMHKNREIKLPAGTSFMSIQGMLREGIQVKGTAPTWTMNESSFKSIPLKFVLAEFERQFDVKVNTKNVDENQLFTGAFSNRNINFALESISTPSQLEYEIRDDKVLFYAENTP